MGDFSPSDALGALLATLSGVIVALLTHYLSVRREAARERRLLNNARALLALEVHANRAALLAFWRTITALATPKPGESDAPADAEHPAAPGSWEELAMMFKHGLAGYSAPTWSTVRWQHVEPRTIGAFNSSEIITLDGVYRVLREVTDLYHLLSAVTPTDQAEYAKNVGGRFWFNDIARDRLALYARLRAAASQILDMSDPLPDATPNDK
jgi:hypothetical protein